MRSALLWRLEEDALEEGLDDFSAADALEAPFLRAALAGGWWLSSSSW